MALTRAPASPFSENSARAASSSRRRVRSRSRFRGLSSTRMTVSTIRMTEFDRQAAALGLPAALAEPLRDAAAVAEPSDEGRIPFLLVSRAAPPLDALG